MLPNLREYHRPDSLAEASRLLLESPLKRRPLAGGTRLIASQDPAIEELVDLQGLPMDKFFPQGDELVIESLVTLQRIIDSEPAGNWADGILCQAALSRSASKMIRNRSSLGGELASRDPYSAMAAVLLALDASVQLLGSSEETLPASLFFAQRGGWLDGGALVTAVRVPKISETGGCDLQRLSVIESARPILCVAALVRREGRRATQVRIAVAGGCPVPIRLRLLERGLEGTELSEESLQDLPAHLAPLLAPPADLQASSEYRREVAPVLVRRALLNAWKKAGKE
jgi:carbon-monoxide dehydrogenase medium subunit